MLLLCWNCPQNPSKLCFSSAKVLREFRKTFVEEFRNIDGIHFFQMWIRGSGSTITERWIRGSGSTFPKCGFHTKTSHGNFIINIFTVSSLNYINVKEYKALLLSPGELGKECRTRLPVTCLTFSI